LNKLFCLTAVLTTLLSSTNECHAAFMTQSGVTGNWADLFNSNNPKDYNDYWNFGSTYSSAGGSLGGSSASASINLIPGNDAGIHLLSESRTGPSARGLRSQTTAAARWVDVLRVAGAGPTSLRVTVHATGTVVMNNFVAGGGTYARIGISSGSGSGLSGGPPTIAGAGDASASEIVAQRSQASPGTDYFVGSNTSMLTWDPSTGSASWDAHFILPYNAGLGGFQLNLFASAQTHSVGADTVADFGHTFRLTGVTLADGSPVGRSVTFDSRFDPNPTGTVATPAPSSLLVMGLGLGFGAWLRRRV